jgi:O-antigen/teichoic acid export membrane protein
MELNKKIGANLLAQLYMAGAGIIVTPLYLKLMGAEAYGLVGVFTLIQALFNILDLGLSPTLARETARARGGDCLKDEYINILYAIKKLFLITSTVGCSALILASDFLANNWLQIYTLDKKEVQQALIAIAVCVSLRWISGLYRATITGFEEFEWLSYWNILITTLRFLMAIPILYVSEGSFLVFFLYQVIVAFFEIFGLVIKSRQLVVFYLGKNLDNSNLNSIQAIRPLLGFAGGVAFTSIIWALITQTDKIVLSKLLTLTEYGYFTIGVLLASGITIIGGTITNTAIPKLSLLYATHDTQGMSSVYKRISQYTAIAVIPLTLILIFYQTEIIEIWTGDPSAAQKSGYVLGYYAAGNCLMTVASLPLLLQYAEGNLKLHVIGNVLYALILYPTLVWSVSIYGVSGACWSWLLVNCLSFLLWTPIIHSKFYKNQHLEWLINDIIKIIYMPFFAIMFFKFFLPMTDDKWMNSLLIIFVYIFSLMLSPFGIEYIRRLKLRISDFGSKK